MKISNTLIIAASTLSTVHAFAPVVRHSRAAFPMHMAEAEEVAESAMPASDPYERIGISKEEMGLGIDATEFLQWIGT